MFKQMLKASLFISIGLNYSLANAATEPANLLSEIAPFSATYTLLHKKDEVGTAQRKLKKLSDNSYIFSYETDLEWLIFSDKRKEISTLKIENGVVVPISYEYIREGTGKDKHKKWRFDRENNRATDLIKNKEKKIEWLNGVQDKLSYHLQSRLNLHNNIDDYSYSVFSHGGDIQVDKYQFEYAGEETLMLPYGVIETIKLKREIPEKKKATYAWFAPSLDYMMVKLYHQKGGFEQFEAQLLTLDYPKQSDQQQPDS